MAFKDGKAARVAGFLEFLLEGGDKGFGGLGAITEEDEVGEGEAMAEVFAEGWMLFGGGAIDEGEDFGGLEAGGAEAPGPCGELRFGIVARIEEDKGGFGEYGGQGRGGGEILEVGWRIIGEWPREIRGEAKNEVIGCVGGALEEFPAMGEFGEVGGDEEVELHQDGACW